MQRCWDKDTKQRPSFGALIDEFLELLSDLIWIEPGKASIASEAIANRDADMMALVDGLSQSKRKKNSIKEKQRIRTRKPGGVLPRDAEDDPEARARKKSLLLRRTSSGGHELITRNSNSLILRSEEGNKLTTEQVCALKALFHDIDHDKNGYISREEASELFDQATLAPEVPEGRADLIDDWKADAMIQALDTNNDGQVSMDEWIVYCANLNWMGMLDTFLEQMESALKRRNRLTSRSAEDFKSMENIIKSAKDVVTEKGAANSVNVVNVVGGEEAGEGGKEKESEGRKVEKV